ncbi:MAG: tetratricopeptide repeat protein [Terriglobales bacterium]|jgi:tetratricopeptide (TPR) repeat protein
MKHRFANAILLMALTACTFAQTHTTVRHYKERIDDQPPEIAQAEDAIQKNDFTAAETLLKKAIDKDHNNYQAWFDLGFVLNRLGRADESIAAYRKSVTAKPDVFESNLNLGLMLARANNPEAEQFLRAATTLKPTAHPEEGQARAWLALAHLLENKEPEDAFQAYGKASELTPKDPEPHLSAGLLHERQKEFSAAEAEYKQVLTLDPHNIDPHNIDPHTMEAAIGLTNLYMKSGRLGEAEPLLRRLGAERPDDAGIHLQLGRVLAAQGKKEDAITEIQTSLKLAPADSDAQRDLADLLVQSKKLPDAEQVYRDLIKAHPNDAELHQLLGEVLLKERKYPDAQQEFMVTVKVKPDFGVAYGTLAIAANENQNYALAIKALEVRAKLLPETPSSYFERASALDHLRDYKQAAQYYHLFLDAANGKYPDDEWKARHRLIWIESKKR